MRSSLACVQKNVAFQELLRQGMFLHVDCISPWLRPTCQTTTGSFIKLGHDQLCVCAILQGFERCHSMTMCHSGRQRQCRLEIFLNLSQIPSHFCLIPKADNFILTTTVGLVFQVCFDIKPQKTPCEAICFLSRKSIVTNVIPRDQSFLSKSKKKNALKKIVISM